MSSVESECGSVVGGRLRIGRERARSRLFAAQSAGRDY